MKKKFGIYAVIWAVALVVFNVVSFTVALNTGDRKSTRLNSSHP